MDDMLKIGVMENAGTTVLKLSGDLDSFTSPRLSRYGKGWLRRSSKLIVNLDDLDYIDSTGLSALVAIWVNTRDQGIPMVISCRSPRIYRVFEITGLLNLFTVVVSKAGSAARSSLTTNLDTEAESGAEKSLTTGPI